MATVTKPIALDESFNTTEVTPRNIADVLAEGFSHITGRTASEVEYDNTDSGLTSDDVQGAIDELSERPTLPTTDIQTAVDEFETYNGGLLSECKVALSPIQDLHGYDHPWVGGAGKNLFNPTALTTTQDGVTFTNNGNGTYTLNGTATADIDFPIESFSVPTPSVQYKMVGCPSGLSSNVFLQIRGTSWYDDGNGIIATTGDTNVHPVQIRVKNGATFNNVVFKPMFSTDTTITYDDYEPYSNICPISGHTQVDVEDDGKNRFDVNTYYSITSRITIADNKINFENSNYSPAIYHLNLKQGTYTFSTDVELVSGSAYCKFRYLDEPSGNLGSISTSASGVQTVTFTVTRDETVYVEFCGASSTSTGSFTNCQLELGSTATAYEPYNGYQVTVNLGGTYYSGTLDVVSGVFVPDTAKAVTPTRGALDSSGKLYTINFSGGTIHNYTDTGIATPYVMCSHLDIDSLAGARDTQRKCICQYAGAVYIGGYVGEETALDNMLASADFSIVFELATPTPIQLSPTMVKALVGENHLSAPLDGQEITESKYKQAFTFDDVIAYIQSLS